MGLSLFLPFIFPWLIVLPFCLYCEYFFLFDVCLVTFFSGQLESGSVCDSGRLKGSGRSAEIRMIRECLVILEWLRHQLLDRVFLSFVKEGAFFSSFFSFFFFSILDRTGLVKLETEEDEWDVIHLDGREWISMGRSCPPQRSGGGLIYSGDFRIFEPR